MKKVELLAPAGNYESFLAAIHAGADAVYLAGNQFGARAFADNFTAEELSKAVCCAHLWHRKIYLTVNTLLRETEINNLYSYLLPLYELGLDGVIVQDIGVFHYIKAAFPDMELHVSTQMAVTGVRGAKLLKRLGAVRIVPARELSLEEIREIKQQVPIEIETFVHGALCYCYSGNCLFSSILGGRSGNRGKCAQPCRLPYQVQEGNKMLLKGEQYPLSLKDLSTLQIIPELIEAGIDSFKIEGRMKKPEYVAGVTSLYRKYIDRYYELSLRGFLPKEPFLIAEEDRHLLETLYIRSDLHDGYYHKHNGRNMITLSKPSYNAADEAILRQIRTDYIETGQQIAVQGAISIEAGCPVSLRVDTEEYSVYQQGDTVQQASSRPITIEDVKKQLNKTGNSPFVFIELQILMEQNAFLPLKELNQLRRNALEKLEQEMLKKYTRSTEMLPQEPVSSQISLQASAQAASHAFRLLQGRENDSHNGPGLYATAATLEQYEILARQAAVERIYLFSDCLAESAFEKLLQEGSRQKGSRQELYLCLPHVIRKRSQSYLERLEIQLKQHQIAGVMIRNLESYQWLLDIAYEGNIVLDTHLYCFNSYAQHFWAERTEYITVPYELNSREMDSLQLASAEIVVYGYIPMMLSANCVRETAEVCAAKTKERTALIDRFRKTLTVGTNCTHCYNVIYNNVPLSLHKALPAILNKKPAAVRLDFTWESAEETMAVVQYFTVCFRQLQNGQAGDEAAAEVMMVPPYTEFTNGHYKRGVD